MATMTNADLQAFMDINKDNIFAIGMDNNKTFFFGYTDSPSINDIKLETVGGVDYIVLGRVDMFGKKAKYKLYQLTEYVQWIGVVSDETSKMNPDPLLFK